MKKKGQQVKYAWCPYFVQYLALTGERTRREDAGT
jgi:hypothetical protein